MPIERILAATGLVLSLLLLWRFGPSGWRAWQIYSGVRSRRMSDAGPLEITPPDLVASRLDELEALGFTRIGERFLQLPGTPLRYEWLVGEPSGETYVIVVAVAGIGTMAAGYSSFDDGTWVQTNFPRGASITRRDFFASFVSTNLTDMLAAHRRQVATLRAAHGTPRSIRTMADTLRMDAEYRTRHGGVTLRRLTFKLISPALAAAALAVISFLLGLLAR
ncbi:MAG TPA: hypothetical protein VGQ85_05995 [Candidatus Limnocylindrales bacterium]|nr:hypothetical protein [Candidatus Limnocylindrales bacterium]